MSNFLAIATVTETLHQLLQATVQQDVPGATVTMVRPEDDANGNQGARINVYLFRVTPNAALRNSDLPLRRPNSALQERPRVALDLHYLFTFFGNEGQLEPQRLLGSAVRTLHANAIVTRQMITDVLGSTAFNFLAPSNLVEQPELVKLTPAPLSLDDLSKIWSVFFQTRYALSVVYEATVVLIEGDETPLTALPVKRRNLQVLPFRNPRIDRVRNATGHNDPILAGDTVIVEGNRLEGDVTNLRIGGHVVTPNSIGDSAISVTLTSPPLPAGGLRAGVQGIQVVQQVLFGTPSDPHRGFESNVAPFVMRPIVTAVSVAGNQVTVTVVPPVRSGQRIALLLNQRLGVSPAAHAFSLPPAAADTSTPIFTVSGITAGSYFVRVQIDGAESPIDVDPTNPTFGPTVTFP